MEKVWPASVYKVEMNEGSITSLEIEGSLAVMASPKAMKEIKYLAARLQRARRETTARVHRD